MPPTNPRAGAADAVVAQVAVAEVAEIVRKAAAVAAEHPANPAQAADAGAAAVAANRAVRKPPDPAPFLAKNTPARRKPVAQVFLYQPPFDLRYKAMAHPFGRECH